MAISTLTFINLTSFSKCLLYQCVATGTGVQTPAEIEDLSLRTPRPVAMTE